MAPIASDLENNHTGRKLSTMAIRLGFLIYFYPLKLFIGNLIQILIFLSSMLTLSLGSLCANVFLLFVFSLMKDGDLGSR